jgi:glycosyltransferase involved in cell wall biosynthesis
MKKRKKIFLPFKVKDIGGTSIFAKKFSKAIKKEGYDVVFEHCDDYDILFIIVDCPLKYVFEAKQKNKKIVQRLDGCYYPVVSGWKYLLMNLKPKIIHNFFADFVVYQSKYSKYSCNNFLGKSKKGKWTIIYNGVDTKRFSQKGAKVKIKDNPSQKIIFTASRFRRDDQIVPIVEGVKELQKTRKDFKLLVAGTLSPNLDKIKKNTKYIKFLGKIPNEDLPKYERSSDIFIQTHLNPPCPNNIIEAITIGLPVCGMNDGSMTELVKNHKTGELLPTKGDAYFKPRKYNAELMAKALNKMLDNIDSYKKALKKQEERFNINQMINKYVEVFKQIR